MLGRSAMIEIVEKSMHNRDIGEVETQLALCAEDCTFRTPVREMPMS